MKARSLFLFLVLTTNLAAAFACSDPESTTDAAATSAGGWIDASTASMGAAATGTIRERYETRVGPQPWPRDLPAHWPMPERLRRNCPLLPTGLTQ